MEWLPKEIANFRPYDEQEKEDRLCMLKLLDLYGESILTRENAVVHMTGSAMVFSTDLNKVLMAYHNIYQSWAWLGGHADGEENLWEVARREAWEESGIERLFPMSRHAVALDILPVQRHKRRGAYVGAHLHLNLTYAFWAPENQSLRVREEENSAVGWLDVGRLEEKVSEPDMLPVYRKIIRRCQEDFGPFKGEKGERG